MNAIATNNLRVWNRFCVTPPAATKNFTKGGWTGTDINPAYRIRCLTELFGPQGTGWGWTIHERWREVWPSRVKSGGEWVDYEAPCAFVMLSLWYIEDGERKECSPQIGGTECDLAPDEVWKMSITDAIGKCCLALGIAADVYMGQFDGKHSREASDRQPQKTRQLPACPSCGKTSSVIPGNAQFGAGLLCFGKKDGCGHKWETAEHPFNENHKGMKSSGSNGTHAEAPASDLLQKMSSALKTTKDREKWRERVTANFDERKISLEELKSLMNQNIAIAADDTEAEAISVWLFNIASDAPDGALDQQADLLKARRAMFPQPA